MTKKRMSAVRAHRLCPNAIFIAPDFTRYRTGFAKRAFHSVVDSIFFELRDIGSEAIAGVVATIFQADSPSTCPHLYELDFFVGLR